MCPNAPPRYRVWLWRALPYYLKVRRKGRFEVRGSCVVGAHFPFTLYVIFVLKAAAIFYLLLPHRLFILKLIPNKMIFYIFAQFLNRPFRAFFL